jgi:putative effector of murein hydrolase
MPASLLPSILRTFVPLAVGYFLAWPVAKWLGLSEDQITSLITAAITAIYYLAVRLLEQVAPQFGWLLGYASKPLYVTPADASKG